MSGLTRRCFQSMKFALTPTAVITLSILIPHTPAPSPSRTTSGTRTNLLQSGAVGCLALTTPSGPHRCNPAPVNAPG